MASLQDTRVELQGWQASSIGFLIRRAQTIYDASLHAEHVGKKWELNDIQFQGLVILSEIGVEDQVTLARQLGVTKTSATRLVDGLERLGLASRRRSDDRRRFGLTLTPAAEELIRHEWNGRRRAEARLFSVISEEESQFMIDKMSALVRQCASQAPTWEPALHPGGKGQDVLHDLYRTVEFLMRRSGQIGRALAYEIVGPMDFTEGQAKALFVICMQDHVDLSLLTSAFASERPTLAKILQSLEAKSWIVRGRHPVDARRLAISATPAGIEALSSVRHVWDHCERRMADAIGPASYAELKRVLVRLAD